jgi:hypothetical protein
MMQWPSQLIGEEAAEEDIFSSDHSLLQGQGTLKIVRTGCCLHIWHFLRKQARATFIPFMTEADSDGFIFLLASAAWGRRITESTCAHAYRGYSQRGLY